MVQEFIKKWSSWWRFQKQHEELTDAFEQELNAIIEQEVAKNLQQPDVPSSAKPKVTVGGWGTINCSHCGEKNVAGIITMWIDDTPEHVEICNLCLKKHYIEVK